jgi:cytochrome c6
VLKSLKQLLQGGFVAALIATSMMAAYAKEPKSPGKTIFEANCVFCHGDDGTGHTPPGMALGAHDLTAAEVKKKTDNELTQTISQGRNKMPAFGDKLDANQIHDLISYIRTLGKK